MRKQQHTDMKKKKKDTLTPRVSLRTHKNKTTTTTTAKRETVHYQKKQKKNEGGRGGGGGERDEFSY